MIVLYDKNKTNGFNRNNLVLKNVTKCEVTWEKNGQFQIDLVYPIIEGDTAWQQIVKGAIVKCPVAYQQDQLFRLNTPSKKIDENSGYFYIEASGYHITYDLNDNFLEDVRPTSKTGIEAGRYILANTQYSHPFNWIGDITDINTAYYIRKNPINALIGDDDNSYLNRWGGELVRDNFNIGMLKQAGQNRGVVIRYSKNLTGFEQSGDDSNLMTRCLPYCDIDTSSTDDTTDTNTDEDLKPVLKLPEKYIDSPLINKYSHPYVKAVQVELTEDQQKYTDVQKYKIMRDYVNNLYNSNHVDVPVYSYSVNFINLANTEEYKDYAILEEVHPYDYVTVKALGIDVIAELVGYTYDSLNRQYETITLGNIQNDIIRHNQKSLFQISKQNEKNIRILQAQMQDVPNSIQTIAANTTSGGNNLFDHSVLEDKYITEWVKNGASVIEDNTLHDTDKVWKLPPNTNISKEDIMLNPNNYNGQQMTFSLSAKWQGVSVHSDLSSQMTDTVLGTLDVVFQRCLASNSPSSWTLKADGSGIVSNKVIADGGVSFTVTNTSNYSYIPHAYDSSGEELTVDGNVLPSGTVSFDVEINNSNLTPEQLIGFSIYETNDRTLNNMCSIYATSSDSDWQTMEQQFMLGIGADDIIKKINFRAENKDTNGTIYIGGFMLNTGTVRSDYSQSSNDTVETLRAHQIIVDSLDANYAHIKDGVIDNATIGIANVTNLNAKLGIILDLTTNTLKSHIIDTDQLAAGAITAGSGIIATGAIQTEQVADSSITDSKIVSLTANKITAGTIDAGQIDVINLKAANITVGTINGQQIAQNTISTGNLTNDLSTSITTAISNANNAITAVNGKNSNYYGSTPPTSPNNGDLWMKPVDGGIKPMQWNGNSWIDMTDITAIMAKQGIDGLQIGIRNLILNGDFSQGSKNWTCNTGVVDTAVQHNGHNSIKIDVEGHKSNTYWGIYQGGLESRVEAGKQYVLSFWAYTTNTRLNDETFRLYFNANDSNGNLIDYNEIVGISSTDLVNNTWTKFTAILNVQPNMAAIAFHADFARNGLIWLSDIMLVKGNKAPSDFISAPEDQTAYTDSAVNDIQIGFTNLWKNSSFELRDPNVIYNPNNWIVRRRNDLTSPLDSTKPLLNTVEGNYAIFADITFSSTTNSWFGVSDDENGVSVKPNTQYTVSFDFTWDTSGSVTDSNCYIILRDSSVNWVTNFYIPMTINDYRYAFKRCSYTFTTTSTTTNIFLGFGLAATSGSYCWVAVDNIKLEAGNKATDWSPAPQDTQSQISGITLTNIVGVTGDSSLVTKTSSDGWGNAGCSSVEGLGEGDYIEYVIPYTNGTMRQMVGLSHVDTDPNYTSIQYAWYTDGNGTLSIFENGTQVVTYGSAWYWGDKFRISMEQQKIHYYHNGTLVYTSNTLPTLPLVLDLALYNQNSSISNITKGHMLTGLSTDVNYLKTTIKELDASYITTGTLSADRIGSKTITADKLITGCITSASGVVGALDAGAITTGTLAAERIGANSITGDKIQTGAITTNALYCNGNLNNVAQNANVTVTAGIQDNGGMCSQSLNSMGMWRTSTFPSSATVDLGYTIYQIEEISFDTYFPSDNRFVPSSYLLEGSVDNTNWSTIVDVTDNNTVNTPKSTFMSHHFNSQFRYIKLTVRAPQVGQSTVQITNFKVMSMQGGTIIDGNMLMTGSILADKIHASTITGDKLIEDAITTREIAAKAVTTNEIASHTIVAGNIQVGTLTSDSGIFGAIDAGIITSGTIDASKINVTNLNASNITSGIISADRINTNDLTAARITTKGSNVYGTIGSWRDSNGENITGFKLYNSAKQDLYKVASGNIGDDYAPATRINVNGAYEIHSDISGSDGAYLILYDQLNVNTKLVDNQDALMILSSNEFSVQFSDYSNGARHWNYIIKAGKTLNPEGSTYNLVATYADATSGIGRIQYCNPCFVFYTNDNTQYMIQSSRSDERLKENIAQSPENYLNTIHAINIVQYDWIKDKKHVKAGVTAQQLYKVNEDFSQTFMVKDNVDYYAPDWDKVMPYTIGAIQQEDSKVEELKSKIISLENRIAILEQKTA